MTSDRLPKALFVTSVLMLSYALGVVAEHYDLFPLPWLKSSVVAFDEALQAAGLELPWYYSPTVAVEPVTIAREERMAPGLTLVARMGPGDQPRVTVVDPEGGVIHEWVPDWFEIWPDATHVPDSVLPKAREGGWVHGVTLMEDGDIVFNFERLGLVRMDMCGDVEWKLPRRTHHSIARGNDGNLWVPGVNVLDEPLRELPNYDPPIQDFTLLQITPDGAVLQELSVFDLLQKNGRAGLMYLSSIANRTTEVSHDTMHLNDIEIFPDSLAPGVFSPGDVMISLRNINAVIVFDASDWTVEFASVGRVLRQHDPDFVDGNTITIFDNNNLLGSDEWETDSIFGDDELSSRVVRLRADTRELSVVYEGTPEHPLFTDIMGQHERLPNGNLLITESVAGRVLEVDPRGETVWEYVNVVEPDLKGIVSDAHRLAPTFGEEFFAAGTAACEVG